MNFEEFQKNILIVMTTFNRKAVTEICLKNIYDHKGSATLWVFDDYSTEYDLNYLKLIAPNAEFHRPQIKYGIEQLRLYIQLLASKTEYKFIYHIDNDCYHDPGWAKQLYKIYQQHKGLIGLYNTMHHFHRTIEAKGEYILRKACPGISFFYEQSKMLKIPTLYNSWDFVFGDILGPAAISTNSYVEHFGANGMHNGDFESDRASNPTPWLIAERERILKILQPDKKDYIVLNVH